MINKDKILEVQKLLRKGAPQGEIHNDLLKEGYSEDDIKKIFVPHKYDMRSWYLISAVFIFILGVGFFVVRGSFLVLILSGLMFWMYSNERKRVKKENSL